MSETLQEQESDMLTAANNLESEKAALLRDQIRQPKRQFSLTGRPVKALATKAASVVSDKNTRGRE